jgi:hypothetical protein
MRRLPARRLRRDHGGPPKQKAAKGGLGEDAFCDRPRDQGGQHVTRVPPISARELRQLRVSGENVEVEIAPRST